LKFSIPVALPVALPLVAVMMTLEEYRELLRAKKKAEHIIEKK